jgi:hypothetical protein
MRLPKVTAEKYAGQVDFDDLLPLGKRGVFRRLVEGIDPGIVDEDIGTFECIGDPYLKRCDGFFVRHIDRIGRTARVDASHSACAAASVASSRPAMTTVAPNVASAFAIARPSPRPPPVTTATSPSKRKSRSAWSMGSTRLIGSP